MTAPTGAAAVMPRHGRLATSMLVLQFGVPSLP